MLCAWSPTDHRSDQKHMIKRRQQMKRTTVTCPACDTVNRDLSIVLEDVARENEMASKERVRLIFTPEGSVEEADGIFRRKEERKSWYKKW